MASLYPVFLLLHIASVVVWVGGMFFAYMCLRPVAAQLLEPPQRLRLWRDVFARFFPWVWGAIVLIPVSGMSILIPVGVDNAPSRWFWMLRAGTVMIAIYLYVFFGPYRALRKAVAESDWKAGGAALGRIRRWVGVNTILGFVTIAIVTLGRYLPS